MPLYVASAPHRLEVSVDCAILTAALHNLLQNALKLSRALGKVSLVPTVRDGRVLFDVQDECGGLPQFSGQRLHFYDQRGATRQSCVGHAVSGFEDRYSVDPQSHTWSDRTVVTATTNWAFHSDCTCLPVVFECKGTYSLPKLPSSNYILCSC